MCRWEGVAEKVWLKRCGWEGAALDVPAFSPACRVHLVVVRPVTSPLSLSLPSPHHPQGGGTFSCSVNVPEAGSAAMLGLCSGPYSTKRAAKEAAAAAALGQLMQQLGRL